VINELWLRDWYYYGEGWLATQFGEEILYILRVALDCHQSAHDSLPIAQSAPVFNPTAVAEWTGGARTPPCPSGEGV
jgi:hypothetical protein